MVRRIDFLGAPGVGKSTLYNKILKEDINRFISERNAILRAGATFTKKLPAVTAFALRNGLKALGLQRVLLNYILDLTSNLNLEQSVKKNRSFYDVADNIYCKSSNPVDYRKFQGYIRFFEKMRSWEFIETYFTDNKLILSDESISQKVYGLYGIRSVTQEDLKYVNQYFSTMPLPTGLIYVYSDVKNIIKNIKQREAKTGYLIPGHRNIDIEELEKRVECALVIAEIGCKLLAERGVSVLKVKSTDSIEENFRRTEQFLNGR